MPVFGFFRQEFFGAHKKRLAAGRSRLVNQPPPLLFSYIKNRASSVFKSKNFHFIDSKGLTSCKKADSILTSWTLVRIAQLCSTVVGIGGVGNDEIRATSKCWSQTIVAEDSLFFFPFYQRHLCWWQILCVDEAEQERLCGFSVTCRRLTQNKNMINLH